jgi:peptide/nickel transport system permease protein
MVREGTPMMVAFPHMSLFPAFAIITLVMGFNLVADGLQELSDDRR